MCRRGWAPVLLLLYIVPELLVGRVAAVQPVVLHHEHQIEEHGDEAQPELGEVPEDGVPVVVVVADEEHLDHGEDAAREVQDDVADAPAHRTFAPENR